VFISFSSRSFGNVLFVSFQTHKKSHFPKVRRFWKTRGTTIASDLFALLVVGLDVAVFWLNEKNSCPDKSAVGISVICLFMRYD